MATYNGVRILTANGEKIRLRQGKLCLEIDITPGKSHPLQAPKIGQMVDTIHESNCTPARFRFWVGDRLVISQKSDHCSFEDNLNGTKIQKKPPN